LRCARVGFYGYGEIAQLEKDGISHYHNETFTTLLLGGRAGVDDGDRRRRKLQKEIRYLKKQVERLEASRATFELMVDRNDNLLSRQLELSQHQAEELNRINLLADSALDSPRPDTGTCRWTVPAAQLLRTSGPDLRTPPEPRAPLHEDFGPRMCARATKRPPRSRWRTSLPSSLARSRV